MRKINWIYFGVFIDESSKLRNLKALQDNGINIPDDWKMFNHHMTIAFNNRKANSQYIYEQYKNDLGVSKKLIVDGIGISDDAIAIRINYTEPMMNKIAHITIATPSNGKPINSNYITKWIDIEPYEINGILTQFSK